MKKIFTTLLIQIALFFFSTINAQVITPDGENIIGQVEVLAGGTTPVHVELTARGWYAAQDGGSFGEINDYSYPPEGISANKSAADEFIVYWPLGQYKIYQAIVSAGIVNCNQIDSDAVVPSYNQTVIKGGKFLYAIAGGFFLVKRAASTSWVIDTAGLPQTSVWPAFDFDVDSNGNIYAANPYGGLYYQAAGSLTFSKVLTFPALYPGAVMIDRQNRVMVNANEKIYISADNGSTWDSTNALPDGGGLISEDAFGNIYSNNGRRAFRSEDNGLTWSRIDTVITNKAFDTTYYYPYSTNSFINVISGDSLIYAATIWGLYVSGDQGNTWQPNNKGRGCAPHGYWLFGNGRQVATTDLGIFIKNVADTTWTQTFPDNGQYLKADTIIQGDALGNIYTVIRCDSVTMPMMSSDQGATWTPDTNGIANTNADYTSYYVDESGNSHMTGYSGNCVYAKAIGGSYTPDTIGMRRPIGGPDIGSYVSDHSGYLYAFAYYLGYNPYYVPIWRRPLNGSAWTPDTVLTSGPSGLFGPPTMKLEVYDNFGSVFTDDDLRNLYVDSNLYWPVISQPTVPPSLASALGGDMDNDLMAAFSSNDFFNNYGVFCSGDHGNTWNHVPGLSSVRVNSMETFGDTTYLLTTLGLYKMTCNGVVGGISEPKPNTQSMTIYPNPASTECHIMFSNSLTDAMSLNIQDITSRVIKSIPINSNEINVETDNMETGMYICTIMSDGKVINSKKFIVE